MPRLPKGRNVKWKITLPADLAGRAEMEIMDKDRGTPIYGLRSQLIRELLADWLARGTPVTSVNPTEAPEYNENE